MAIEKVKLEDFLRKIAAGDELKLNGVILFIHPRTEVLLEAVQILTSSREVRIIYRYRLSDSRSWEPYSHKWDVNPDYTVLRVSCGRMERTSAAVGSRSCIRIESATS